MPGRPNTVTAKFVASRVAKAGPMKPSIYFKPGKGNNQEFRHRLKPRSIRQGIFGTTKAVASYKT